MNSRKIEPIDQAKLDELLQRARVSPRKRTIHRLHTGDWEHCHRMLNALTPGTYVRPHRHSNEHNSEGFVVLRGKMALLFFDDEGRVLRDEGRLLSAAAGCFGMDIAPNIWHTLVALEDTVIYEVKGHPTGGYIEADAKDFAHWAPEEGSDDVAEYLCGLEKEAEFINQ